MKTVIRLKKNMAAIVFTDTECRLVYPAQEGAMPGHVAMAASVILALQYDSFLDYLAEFTKKIADESQQEVAH